MNSDNPLRPTEKASPDFRAKTVEALARRAGFLCSNPDCRARTIGPNSDPEKATTIGEAAHIMGARPRSKRFNAHLSDGARAAITNGIWLCRNCHKKIDADEQRYTSTVLFTWREMHEQFVLSELGNSADRILGEQQKAVIEGFSSYPPLIRRIVLDKPDGWEWRLTAELMRHLNDPVLRKISDIREGVVAAPQEHIAEEAAPNWVQQRLVEMSRLMQPFGGLTQRLNDSWGKPGESGSVEEIHHVCVLFRDSLQQIALFEERVYFVNAPESYQKVLSLLRNVAGSQADKFAEIPAFMDELLLVVDSSIADGSGSRPPKRIEKTITLEVSEEHMDELVHEFKRAQGLGCLVIAGLVLTIWSVALAL